MNIDLTRDDITKILKEKFGEDTSFRCFYVESDKCFEKRTGIEMSEYIEPQKKEEYLLFFD